MLSWESSNIEGESKLSKSKKGETSDVIKAWALALLIWIGLWWQMQINRTLTEKSLYDTLRLDVADKGIAKLSLQIDLKDEEIKQLALQFELINNELSLLKESAKEPIVVAWPPGPRWPMWRSMTPDDFLESFIMDDNFAMSFMRRAMKIYEQLQKQRRKIPYKPDRS